MNSFPYSYPTQPTHGVCVCRVAQWQSAMMLSKSYGIFWVQTQPCAPELLEKREMLPLTTRCVCVCVCVCVVCVCVCVCVCVYRYDLIACDCVVCNCTCVYICNDSVPLAKWVPMKNKLSKIKTKGKIHTCYNQVTNVHMYICMWLSH